MLLGEQTHFSLVFEYRFMVLMLYDQLRFLHSTTSYDLKRMKIVDGRKEDGNSSTLLVCFERSSANEIYGHGGSVTSIRMIIIVLGSGV